MGIFRQIKIDLASFRKWTAGMIHLIKFITSINKELQGNILFKAVYVFKILKRHRIKKNSNNCFNQLISTKCRFHKLLLFLESVTE